MTYGIGEIRFRWETKLPGWVPFLLTVFCWGFLILAKNPNLVSPVNVFRLYPIRIVGISYMVFRCMHYMLDAAMIEKRRMGTLLNYVVFFPTLLAGPIERYENFQAYYEQDKLLDPESVLPALHRIANGVIKKFLIADTLASLQLCRPDRSAELLWIGMFLQLAILYWDFSGYCDIVIGLSRLFRMKLCENFNKPWLARNVQEFWERWHISLTSLIRDYCFNPISVMIVRRVKPARQFPLIVLAYFFTMMLIAFWHGTTMGFFWFGLIHGTMLVLSQCTKHYILPRLGASARTKWMDGLLWVTFRRVVTYAWISPTLLLWRWGPETTWEMLQTMIGMK
ncbi:MAG: MBOAT family protein [Phycisphaerae bacterium]|nr:MBOAT family protein [Phycisphaerae bacterium]